MRRGSFWAVMALAALLLSGVAPALAHGRPAGRYPPIQGTVTGVANGTLQVQSASGTVTVSLTGATRIFRLVDGTLADVPVNAEVDAHLVPGTTTVDAIQVDDTVAPKPVHVRLSGHRRLPLRPRPSPPHAPELAPGHVAGRVVAVTDTSLTLRDWRGKDTTYSISDSVTVIKVMNGNPGDLSIGETVRVIRGPNGNAQSVTILSA